MWIVEAMWFLILWLDWTIGEVRISKDGGRCGGRECVAVAVETANFYEVR